MFSKTVTQFWCQQQPADGQTDSTISCRIPRCSTCLENVYKGRRRIREGTEIKGDREIKNDTKKKRTTTDRNFRYYETGNAADYSVLWRRVTIVLMDHIQ